MNPKKTHKKLRQSSRIKQKRADVRQEILSAAEDLLGEGGVEAITLASVAGKLQLTKQALYHYFSSKDDLVRSLMTKLLDDEIESIVAIVEATDNKTGALGTMIRAFYVHYISHLDAFRTVYCQPQLQSSTSLRLDKETIRDKVNPRTRYLFDVLEERLSNGSRSKKKRSEMRRLAFAAWLAALGLLTMLGLADALSDALIHEDEDLLNTLIKVFDEAATP